MLLNFHKLYTSLNCRPKRRTWALSICTTSSSAQYAQISALRQVSASNVAICFAPSALRISTPALCAVNRRSSLDRTRLQLVLWTTWSSCVNSAAKWWFGLNWRYTRGLRVRLDCVIAVFRAAISSCPKCLKRSTTFSRCTQKIYGQILIICQRYFHRQRRRHFRWKIWTSFMVLCQNQPVNHMNTQWVY